MADGKRRALSTNYTNNVVHLILKNSKVHCLVLHVINIISVVCAECFFSEKSNVTLEYLQFNEIENLCKRLSAGVRYTKLSLDNCHTTSLAWFNQNVYNHLPPSSLCCGSVFLQHEYSPSHIHNQGICLIPVCSGMQCSYKHTDHYMSREAPLYHRSKFDNI